MKKKILIGTFALVSILAGTFAVESYINEANAGSIICVGDSLRVCADGTTGDGGTWRMYGDKGIYQE